MAGQVYNCKICGLENLSEPHSGSVDCISHYRRWVEHLSNLLPQGREVMRVSLARETDARIWIAGEITFDALERLITFVRFMQEAWTEAPVTKVASDTSGSNDLA